MRMFSRDATTSSLRSRADAKPSPRSSFVEERVDASFSCSFPPLPRGEGWVGGQWNELAASAKCFEENRPFPCVDVLDNPGLKAGDQRGGHRVPMVCCSWPLGSRGRVGDWNCAIS